MPFEKGKIANPHGRPRRIHERKALNILREIVNDARHKELCLIAFFGARGFKPEYKDNGEFSKFIPDPKSSPLTRLAYIRTLWDRKMGVPAQHILVEDETGVGVAFDDWMRSVEPDKFDLILERANEFMKKG